MFSSDTRKLKRYLKQHGLRMTKGDGRLLQFAVVKGQVVTNIRFFDNGGFRLQQYDDSYCVAALGYSTKINGEWVEPKPTPKIDSVDNVEFKFKMWNDLDLHHKVAMSTVKRFKSITCDLIRS